MKLSAAFDEFIRYQHLRNNSAATIENYTVVISKFIEWADDIDCAALTADKVNDYNLYLQDCVQLVSVRTYIRHIRVFLHFCMRKKWCPDFYNDIIMPKRTVKVVEILTPEEIKKLMGQFGNDFYGLRNMSMVMLMLDCGLRANEVITLVPDNINYKYKYVKVFGKGRKERIVPMGNALVEVLKRYTLRRPVYADFLFVSAVGDPLKRSAFKKLFKRLREKTGIKRLHPHLLRHTFATNYLLYSDGDIYKLSMLLGHSDVTTSEIYLHYANYFSFMQQKKAFSFLDTLGRLGALDSLPPEIIDDDDKDS